MALMEGRVQDGTEEPLQPWRLRDVQWRKVFARMDYANFCLTLFIVVAAILIYTLADPHLVPYVMWDARISYPHLSDTIPSWVAIFVPLICLLLTVAVGEYMTSRRQHASVTDATASFLYFFLDGVQSFVLGVMLTQVLKVMVGRLRPNFLARCQPVGADGVAQFDLASINAAFDTQLPCADTGSEKEGRLAFVSGHTSAAFNLAVYASGYLIWCWHWRRPLPARRLSFGQEFRVDLLNVVAKTWMLGMLCFAWGVGISRIVDYQHDPADVVGGALLGTMIALVYLLRAIPRWRRYLVEDVAVCNGGPFPPGGRVELTSGDVEAPIISAHGPSSAKRY